MNRTNTSVIGGTSSAPYTSSFDPYDLYDTYEKWPVWARWFIILGLSALLWAGIISAFVALFG